MKEERFGPWRFVLVVFVMLLAYLGMKFPLVFAIYWYVAFVCVVLLLWTFIMSLFMSTSRRGILWWIVYMGVSCFAIIKLSLWFWASFNSPVSPLYALVLVLVGIDALALFALASLHCHMAIFEGRIK